MSLSNNQKPITEVVALTGTQVTCFPFEGREGAYLWVSLPPFSGIIRLRDFTEMLGSFPSTKFMSAIPTCP